jgi:hypothetical protein
MVMKNITIPKSLIQKYPEIDSIESNLINNKLHTTVNLNVDSPIEHWDDIKNDIIGSINPDLRHNITLRVWSPKFK